MKNTVLVAPGFLKTLSCHNALVVTKWPVIGGIINVQGSYANQVKKKGIHLPTVRMTIVLVPD